MKVINDYGWFFLFIFIIGEIVIPFVLALFYKNYNHNTMTISVLGNKKSPVRTPFNIWMLLAGILLILSTPSLYNAYSGISKPLSMTAVIFICVFATGACIFTCFFSAGETKEEITTASVIHGAGSVTGYILMLFVPLLLAGLFLKTGDKISAIACAASFVLAFVSFVLFVMADKPRFKNTVISKEGLWQRLSMMFMYLPLALMAFKNIMENI